jgi:hypothetical protein
VYDRIRLYYATPRSSRRKKDRGNFLEVLVDLLLSLTLLLSGISKR